MTDHRYYIAIDNYSVENKEGRSINISVGNQFVLLEDLHNNKFKVKCIDSSLSDLNQVILPSCILEDMSSPSPMKPPRVVRSHSNIKDRISSLNVESEKSRLSTFGHGGLSDKLSRSLHEPNRSRTLPAPIVILKQQKKEETTANGNEGIENIAVVQQSDGDQKWKRITEDGRAVHINTDTGERWLSSTDESGRQYFYNETSRQSSWKLPTYNVVSIKEEKSSTTEKLAAVSESSNSDNSWCDADSNDSEQEPARQPPRSAPVVTNTPSIQSDECGTRFDIRHIKKEHISGPLFNKLMRTERSGIVEKTKISENGQKVSNKWATFHIVLTGPEILFYKDVKAMQVKPGWPQGKVDMKLKIKNLRFTAGSEQSDNKGAVMQVEDMGAPGSNITYLLRYGSVEVMRAWKIALQYAKRWQDEDRYVDNVYSNEPSVGTVDDVAGTDRQNIGNRLKQLLKKRPTRESLEARGILRLESVFGSSLDLLCDQEKNKVPEFVYRSILAIEARGLHHSGIYRVSGNQAKIQKLRLAVDENKYQLNNESMELETLTGAFKLFFKELKEPLLDDEFCAKMIDILADRKSGKNNPYKDVNVSAAKKIVCRLRGSHYETSKALFGHLHKVAALSAKNLMHPSNLSMVWGPNLYQVSGQASAKLAVFLMTHNQIIDFIIVCYGPLFEDA